MDWQQQETFRLLRGSPGTVYQQSTDIEKTVIRDWVRSLLQNQSITVTFTKTDGTQREMLCTLDYRQIPEDKRPKVLTESTGAPKETSHVLRVFDVNKQEWRSFSFERLLKLGVELSFDNAQAESG